MNKLKSFFNKNRVEIFLFLLTVFVRLAALGLIFWWLGKLADPGYSDFPLRGGDSKQYAQSALNLLHYSQFSLSRDLPLMPDAFRTPGYPVFVALIFAVFKSFLAVSIMQIILQGFLVALFYRLVLLFFNRRVALLAAVLLMLEPSMIIYSTWLATDTVFVLVFIASLYLTLKYLGDVRSKNFIVLGLAGILLGYAALVRPIAQYLFIPFILFLPIWQGLKINRQHLLKIILFFLGFLLVVAPWALRNHRLFGTWELSSVGDFTLFHYSAPLFYAKQNNISFNEARDVFIHKLPAEDQNKDLIVLSYINRNFKDISLQYLEQNRLSYVKFHLIKTLPFFLNDGLRNIGYLFKFLNDETAITVSALSLLSAFKKILSALARFDTAMWFFVFGSLSWLIIHLFSIISILRFGIRAERKTVWIIWLSVIMILYFALLAGPWSNARYRLPAEPFMFILAASGFMFVYDKIKHRKNEKENLLHSAGIQ